MIRPLPFPGYFATADGRILSRWTARISRSTGPCTLESIVVIGPYARVLTPYDRKRANGRPGYLAVQLGKHGPRYVHRLVCEAFHGTPADGALACHIDGDNRNNAAANLRWGSHESNVADMHEHDSWAKGWETRHAFSDLLTEVGDE